ncbi:MAG TPA: translation initiation factor IF-1 [Candidatus Methylacidiphilales bacterium]
MSARDSIEVKGTVIEVLDREAYRIELANGHRAIARAGREISATYQPGDTVLLSFHPYDLSRGRIVG